MREFCARAASSSPKRVDKPETCSKLLVEKGRDRRMKRIGCSSHMNDRKYTPKMAKKTKDATDENT